MTRKCYKCKKVLPKSSFFRDKNRKNGFRYDCKQCCSEYQKTRKEYYKKYYKQNRKKLLKQSQAYKKTKKGNEVNVQSNRRMRKRTPEKYEARKAVLYALRRKKLEKLPCEQCGEKKTEAHHHAGYEPENWLNIQWLCRKHHLIVHGKTPYLT